MDQVDNMAVFINGNEVDSTYWSYESQTNSIIFQDEYTTEVGDKLEIFYSDK